MKILAQHSDAEILREIGLRLSRSRLERNLTQAALAEKAGVSKRFVERLESGEVAAQLSGFLRVCRALGLVNLDAFIPEPLPSPIDQLRLLGRQRRRASGKKSSRKRLKKWAWRDRT